MSTFKRKPISPDRLAEVEKATATTPTGGDPRSVIADPPAHADPAGLPERSGLASYAVGSVYEIPTEIIRSNPFNPRAVYSPAAVDEMAISLRDGGQKISATAFVEDGKVYLIEGETRLRACRAISKPTLRVEIKEKPASDRILYEEARAANVERREQTPIDDAVRWKELLEKEVYASQTEIATALKLGQDHVSRVLQLNSFSSRVLQAIADYPELNNLRMLNALREFYVACGDSGEQETLEIILEAVDKGWGYRDIEARRKTATNGPIKRTRGSAQPVEYGGAKGEIKTFEDGGRLQLQLKGLNPEETAKLVETLREALSKQ